MKTKKSILIQNIQDYIYRKRNDNRIFARQNIDYALHLLEFTKTISENAGDRAYDLIQRKGNVSPLQYRKYITKKPHLYIIK